MNMTIINRVFLLVLFCTNFCEAQEQNKKKVDTSYIELLRDKVLLKISFDSKSNSYAVYDINTSTTAKIASKDQRKLSLSFDYDFLGFSLGFSPDFLSGKNSDLKGKSSFFDIDAHFFIGRWIQGFQYSNTKGFYLENTDDFVPDWIEGEDPYQQYPNLRNWRISGYTSFVVNRNFSVRSLTHQIERQKKSAGSLIPSLSYSFDRFLNSDSDFNNSEDVIDINFELAYHYIWVIDENWFISPYVVGSLGPRFSKFKYNDNGVDVIENNQYLSNSLEGGLQLGYASKKMAFGFSLNYWVNSDNEEALFNVTNDKTYALVYFGYRFNAPNFIKKPFDWVHRTIGF